MLRVKQRGGSLQIAGTVDGQRVRISPRKIAGTSDRRSAEIIRIELERRLMAKGTAVPLSVVADEYLAHKRVDSRGTVNMVRRLATVFGKQDAATLDLRDVKVWCQKQGHGPASIVRYVNQAKALLNWGEQAGMYQLAGPLKVALPQEPEGRDVFLSSWEEVERVIACAADWFQPFVRFLFSTGARLGEARNLGPRDVVPEGVVFVTKKGSGRARKRIVPVHGPVRIDIDQRVAKKGVHLFVTPKGGYLHEPIVYREWAAMCAKAGLSDFTPHDARRTFATLLIRRGVDSQVIRQLLGHDGETMLKRYAYLAPSQLAAAVKLVMA